MLSRIHTLSEASVEAEYIHRIFICALRYLLYVRHGPGHTSRNATRILSQTPTTPCPANRMCLKALPYPLSQLSLTKLPRVQEALFREIDVLHRGHVLRRGLADTRGNNDGVGFEDDAVVYELVYGEGLRRSVEARYGSRGYCYAPRGHSSQ